MLELLLIIAKYVGLAAVSGIAVTLFLVLVRDQLVHVEVAEHPHPA